MGRRVEFASTKRIISLVPSQTEYLFDIGLADSIVGVTRFCVHPKQYYRKNPFVGGTKKLDFDAIATLQPDLIIANKEENHKEDIERLEKDYPVWVSDVNTLDDAYDMMQSLGEITGQPNEAEAIIGQIQNSFSQLSTANRKPSVAYFIWRKPYMVAASDTFIDHLLGVAGYQNAFAGKERYPELSEEDICKSGADLVFLSSEPYAFREKHIAEFQAMLPNAKVIVVDGELFSWYGSRLLKSAAYFKALRQQLGL